MINNTIKSKKLNEEIIIKELDNGLKIFYMPKQGFTKKYAVFATNYGSNDNKFVPIGENEAIEVPEGIAHFLEHKLFEEPDGNVFNDFSKLGSYVNAYTNFNQTAYLFTCTDKFYDNLKLLVRFVQNPYFTDENVNKEKGIIEQEIRMYEDSPGWKVFFNCLRGMYHNHPVRIDIAGTVESINRITKETLYKCYNTFYHPKNMILFIVGDIDFDKALEIVEKNQREDIENYTGSIKRFYPEEPKEIKNQFMEEKMSISTPLFNIGFKDSDVGYYGDKLLKKQIVTDILHEMLFGESSEFFQKLYDEGLIDNTFGTQYVGNKDYGYSILGGESEKPKVVMEEILNYITKLKNEKLSEEDFNRIKKKFIGYHLMDFNSLEYIANTFIKYYFNNTSLINYLRILQEVDFKDIVERFNSHFTSENYTLSIVCNR
ncbi:EF-P 5-aminopentanol modification-associated protein YfmH [Thermohalobacter berrensis]|uniref:EF-P 5-aminopentanol modification-associated protein YfmH n=1 Tax=Thermohalobacter berrensis TaxID=99594 RepID=UPI001FAAFC7F|nr:pitrilysin family protein [Thermohalobacter berrensis]